MTNGMAEPHDLNPPSVGSRLAAEREAQGRSLEDVAAVTRIPLRHLQAIDAGDYASLPSPTYAMGFVRAYGRTLGLDEVALAAQVREDMDLPPRPSLTPAKGAARIVPPEPDRIPPRGFAWTAAALAVLMLVGYVVWRSSGPSAVDQFAANAERSVAAETPAPSVPPVATPPATGPVVLTATQDVWVRVRDGSGASLFARTLKPGERFDVPATAADAHVNVARPEALTVTVGGREVGPLGPAGRPVANVSLDPAALLAERPMTGAPGA